MFLPMSERKFTSGPATGTPVAYVFFQMKTSHSVMRATAAAVHAIDSARV